MQLKVLCHITIEKQQKMLYFFQFLISPLIHGVEKQNLYFLSSCDNVFKYTVKYPMHYDKVCM